MQQHHDCIYCPMPTGNGAYVVHRCLSEHIDGYIIAGFHPAMTYFPPLLLKAIAPRRARLVHTSPDHAIFHTRPTTPLVITFHNFVLDAYMRPFSSVSQWLHYRTDLALFTRLAVQRAARITSVSRFTAELARRELRIERNIAVIPNGVDTRLFAPGKKRSGDPVRVFFSGNLTKRKGSQWLEAIADRLNPDICLYATQGLRGHGTVRRSSNLEHSSARFHWLRCRIDTAKWTCCSCRPSEKVAVCPFWRRWHADCRSLPAIAAHFLNRLRTARGDFYAPSVTSRLSPKKLICSLRHPE